jgi:hypothetical protein
MRQTMHPNSALKTHLRKTDRPAVPRMAGRFWLGSSQRSFDASAVSLSVVMGYIGEEGDPGLEAINEVHLELFAECLLKVRG